MFKVGKWRNHKFKIVFKLQFQATQIANPGTKLMVSLIPEDVGKPTVRLGKSIVGEDGNCTWEDPVYETVKLTRDTKLGKIQDKFYHFVVATGSSKKGFVGEILFNFADFVESVAPVTVWQPINGSNSDAALHVTIQNMQGGDDPSVIEENGGATAESPSHSQHRRLKSQLSMSTTDQNSEHGSVDEDYWNTVLFRDDEKSRTSFNEQRSFNSLSNQIPPLNPTRNSSSNSRQDIGTYLETSSSEPSPNWNSLSQRKMSYNARENGHGDEKVTRTRETLSSNASPEHKKEILSLERQVEVMELELQTLRRQVVKETKRGQELSRQVSSLKDEKEVLRAECEKRSSRKNENGSEVPIEKETDVEDMKDRLGEVEDELAHIKSVNKMLKRQLGKTQDSNSELILVVKDLEDRLGKKEKELSQVSSQFRKSKRSDELEFNNRDFHYKPGIEENQGVNKDLNTNDEEVKLLKEKIADIEEELENQIEEKKELQEKMSQVLRDYEISKQKNFDIFTKYDDARQQVIEKENQCNCFLRAIEELESEITKMESVMEKQGEEFSDSSETVHRLETQIKNLENELQNKNREYEDNLTEIMNVRTEQEQRAVTAVHAEEELRKARMNHAAAAQRVQEEFQNLSSELASKFDENEKLTIEAQTEVNELRLKVRNLEEQLITANEDLRLMKDDYDVEVEKLSEQLTEKDKQLEQLLVKLQEECKVIESAKQKHESKSNTLSKENEALRVEMERLTEANYHLSIQSEEAENLRAELEVMKTSMAKTKTLLEVANKEKEDLEKKYDSVKMEAEESVEELNNVRSSYEKKKAMIVIFQSELQQLRAQCDELKNHLSEEKLQNENLKKQVLKQNEDLQRKDREIADIEEKYKNVKESNVNREKVKQNKIARKVQPEGIPSQNGAARGSWKSRKEAEKNQKACDVQSDTEGELARLISEVAEMKEKNRSMESELKEMQDKYSEVSLRFAEVEGERQQLVMTVRNLRNAQKK